MAISVKSVKPGSRGSRLVCGLFLEPFLEVPRMPQLLPELEEVVLAGPGQLGPERGDVHAETELCWAGGGVDRCFWSME